MLSLRDHMAAFGARARFKIKSFVLTLDFNVIYSVDELVLFLQHLDVPEGEILETVVCATIRARPLTDDSIHRFSEMYRIFGGDYGIRGYAAALFWSCFLLAANESEAQR